MTAPFGVRLAEVVAARGPLCVGIDPHPSLLADWGLPSSAAGLERFALTCVEALAGEVAVLKPQSAFFEAFGSAGVAVLERVIGSAREAGALVLLDVKRGDIGSTMAAYAQAYLADDGPLAADAVTLSPFLGFGSLDPAIELASRTGRGVFVLALTSNEEGASVQRAVADGTTVAQRIVDEAAVRNAAVREAGVRNAAARNAAARNAAVRNAAVRNAAAREAGVREAAVREAAAVRDAGAEPVGAEPAGAGPAPAGPGGHVGLVIGATVGRTDFDLSRLDGPILAPGFGAQGGTVADLRTVFGASLPHVLPSSSREILGHGPDIASLRAAALRVRDSLTYRP